MKVGDFTFPTLLVKLLQVLLFRSWHKGQLDFAKDTIRAQITEQSLRSDHQNANGKDQEFQILNKLYTPNENKMNATWSNKRAKLNNNSTAWENDHISSQEQDELGVGTPVKRRRRGKAKLNEYSNKGLVRGR